MLAGMSASKLMEWYEYYTIEPFGEYREELRHGKLMHLLDRAHFTRNAPLAPVDFMHFIERPVEVAEEEDPDVLSARIQREVFGM